MTGVFSPKEREKAWRELWLKIKANKQKQTKKNPKPTTGKTKPTTIYYLQTLDSPCKITESQSSRGWEGHLKITESNAPARARSPKANHTGTHPGRP